MSGTWRKRVRGQGRHARLAGAAAVLLLMSLSAVLAPLIAPYPPTQIDPSAALQLPSGAHWFGTDQLGRDILSRVIFGARITLSIAVASVLVASVVGVPIGIAFAYLGGAAENVGMRAVDVLVSLPEIFVAVFVVAMLGNGLEIIVFTIGFLYLPQFVKVAHNTARSLKGREFVLAARSLGAGPTRIIFREILPNMVPIIVVQMSFTLSFAMLLEAGLSFLGLGVAPPASSWGEMVGSLKNFILINAVPVLFPSAALLVTVLSVNLIGDWLQDRLNPEISR